MTTELLTLPWEQPDWLERAKGWIYAQLDANGMHTEDEIEVVHQRIWSAFLKVQTPTGMVYFKAPAPIYAFEAPLTEALSRWDPAHTAPLIAVDVEQGWILTEDAGVMIRMSGDTATQYEHMVALLAPYAEFQKPMAARVPDLLAMGVEDRRLAVLPALYRQLLADEEQLRVGLELGLTANEYARAQALEPQVQEWCQQLAEMGIPETLAHEELTLPNVLVGERGYTYIDWSDSSVAHPFFSMVVTLRSTAYWLKLEPHGAEMQRMVDAYLEPWTTFASRARVNEAFEVGIRLGILNRALSWQNTVRHLSAEQKQEYLDYVPDWLKDFLTNTLYVG
jgi:hypothetical protein